MSIFDLSTRIREFVTDTPYMYTNHNAAMRIIEQYFPSWQYNGVAKFDDLLAWCKQHLGSHYIGHYETIYFRQESDKAFFLLRWGG